MLLLVWMTFEKLFNIKCEVFQGLSHYSPPPQEIINPRYGIITMLGGTGYKLSDH